MTNAQVAEMRERYEKEISDLRTEVRGLQEANAGWQEQYKRISFEADKWSMFKQFLIEKIVNPAIENYLKENQYTTLSDVEDHLDDNGYIQDPHYHDYDF